MLLLMVFKSSHIHIGQCLFKIGDILLGSVSTTAPTSFFCTDCGDGSQSPEECRELFTLHTQWYQKAAQLLGRPLDCLDACHSGKIRVISPIFSGKMVTNFYL